MGFQFMFSRFFEWILLFSFFSRILLMNYQFFVLRKKNCEGKQSFDVWLYYKNIKENQM